MSRIKRVLLILNDRAGSLAMPERLIMKECRAHKINCTILSPGKLTKQYLARQHNIDAIVAAGGDGTVSKAADVLYQTGIPLPLGVIAIGTLNHFAKDAGLPLSIAEAVKVIARGMAVPIDVGTINGQVFVNNASVGLYAALAHQRETLRPYAGKWLSLLLALAVTTTRVRHYQARLEVDGRTRLERTPLIFVGNNQYHARGRLLARRVTLNGGTLSLYILKTGQPLAILRVCWQMWRKGIKRTQDFEESSARSVTITIKTKYAMVALDGEPRHMEGPLCCQIQPGVLRLLVPEK